MGCDHSLPPVGTAVMLTQLHILHLYNASLADRNRVCKQATPRTTSGRPAFTRFEKLGIRQKSHAIRASNNGMRLLKTNRGAALGKGLCHSRFEPTCLAALEAVLRMWRR